jgi:hypothetical protein
MSRQDDLPAFQRYQLAFTGYLRDPHVQPKPLQVPNERLAVYEEIVFNNLLESISACFPIAKTILGDNWPQLIRDFMQRHSANSPIFRQIPEEFLDYLAHLDAGVINRYPSYLLSLCHYEWVELAVASSADLIQPDELDVDGSLLNAPIVYAPGMQLLRYAYAVHHISPDRQQLEPAETFLAVFRDAQDEVKFVELNAMTHHLLTLLRQTMPAKQALGEIAQLLGSKDTDAIEAFGLEILQDLQDQALIRGTRREN